MSPSPDGWPRHKVLSLLWCFPSLGALWILSTGVPGWKFGRGLVEGLQSVRLEDWVGLALLGVHVAWIRGWWRGRRSAGG